MPRTSLAMRLESLREAAGLTQAELARAAEVSAAYVSLLEKGSRSPSSGCLDRLAAALGVTTEELLHEVRYQPGKPGPVRLSRHRRALREIFGQARAVQMPCRLQQAFKSAAQTKLGLALLAELDRQARPPAFWAAVKHLAEMLNSVEQLFLLHLLVAGADLEDLAPADVGFERPVLWSPLRRWLALVLRVDDRFLVLFPQLGLTTKPGRYRTLDVLIGVGGVGPVTWIDGELDGRGHAARVQEDADRDAEVRMPVMRIPAAEVERPDFAARFVKSVLARCPQVQRLAA